MKAFIIAFGLLSSSIAFADVIRGKEAYAIMDKISEGVHEAVENNEDGFEINDNKCRLMLKTPTIECHEIKQGCHLGDPEAACTINE